MYIDAPLYDQIKRQMPIPCVDLLIHTPCSSILLLKRKNEPASGQWWLPGGRIHYLESRREAATRKLCEECGIMAHPTDFYEIGTFDVILEDQKLGYQIHGITTLFQIQVSQTHVTIDLQSSEALWKQPEEWFQEPLHPFVHFALRSLTARYQISSKFL